MRLQNKVAVVTGGASGIGRQTVELLVSEGAYVVIADIQVAAGEALAGQLGGQARFVPCDVTREADIIAAIDAAVNDRGRLDIMVNNAGAVGDPASVCEITGDGWDRTMDLLLRSAMFGIRHAAKVMIPQGSGSIISTSSSAALTPGVAPVAYSVAKAGVMHLTKCAAIELAPHMVRVNCICPRFDRDRACHAVTQYGRVAVLGIDGRLQPTGPLPPFTS